MNTAAKVARIREILEDPFGGLEGLDDIDRRILTDAAFGKTQLEIAADMKVSHQAISVRQYRMLKKCPAAPRTLQAGAYVLKQIKEVIDGD